MKTQTLFSFASIAILAGVPAAFAGGAPINSETYTFEERVEFDSQEPAYTAPSATDSSSSSSNDNFIGAIYKGEGNNKFGVTSKLNVANLSDSASLDLRTDVYFGKDQPELRPTLTLGGKISPNLTGYLGGGINTNFEGKDKTQAVINGGLDVSLTNDIVVTSGVDYLVDDNDLQGKIGLGYKF